MLFKFIITIIGEKKMTTKNTKYNEEYVRTAAYYNWKNAGCPSGNDEYFWNMALNQLYGSCSCSSSSCCTSKSSSKSSSSKCSSSKTSSSCKTTGTTTSSKSSTSTKKTSSK